MQESPKNYQVWYHRRFLVDAIDGGAEAAATELKFTKAILALDSKNYHAWSHRQWVVKRFNAWDGELSFVEGGQCLQWGQHACLCLTRPPLQRC